MIRWTFPLVLLMVLAGCRSASLGPEPTEAAGLPPVPREFRAAWVATVANIDWPSAPGLTPDQQRAELLAILNQCTELNLNAIVLQVRPACDALYPSELEPWSYYLTGKEGQPPSPMYDPLAFAVEESHARGIELHVWFNPYRAGHATHRGEHAPTHLINTRPDLVRSYGSQLWLDPGHPEVIEHSLAVMLDVVERYDIDGVHMDDYFYPYPVNDDAGNPVPFPDDASYNAYREAGGNLGRDDWRRDSVNTLVRRLYEGIKDLKPHVQLGISPFGIYRPGHPSYIKGFDQYEKLYADAALWLAKGWVDYYTPQLYWSIENPDQSFVGLLRWWHENNPHNRNIWPGLYTSRTGDGSARAFRPTEIPLQVRWSRILADEFGLPGGHVHFSMKALMQNREGLADALQGREYTEPALTPASPWLAERRPAAPTPLGYEIAGSILTVKVEPGSVADTRCWVVQAQRGGQWSSAIVPASEAYAGLQLAGTGEVQRVAVWCIDRAGVGSAVVEVPTGE